MTIAAFLAKLSSWAMSRPDIAALALVGSHARGTAGPESDLDILILSTDAEDYLADTSWLAEFGSYSDCHLEDYGAVQSLRVFYDDGPEAEISLGHPGWAAIPQDSGSAAVVAGGLRILHDPQGLLSALMGAQG